MRRSLLLVICIIFTLHEGAPAAITHQFDKSGRLVPAGKKDVSHYAQREKKYSVPAGVSLRPDVRYEFYPVFGKTFSEIVRSAEENGPLDEKTRKRVQSKYDWGFGWTFEFTFSAEEDEETGDIHCDILVHDIALRYDITITLPALTDDSALNSIEKELWKNHLLKLIETEHSRVKIIKDDSQDTLRSRLGGITYVLLPAATTGNAEKAVERFVHSEAEKIGRDTAAETAKKIREFDASLFSSDQQPTRRR